MVAAIKANTGRNPKELSADAGYCQPARSGQAPHQGLHRHWPAAPWHRRRGRLAQASPGIVARMARKLKRASQRSRYRLRKQLPEPGVRADQAGSQIQPLATILSRGEIVWRPPVRP